MNNLNILMQQIRQNPAAYFQRLGVPQNMMNDPNSIIQYLMSNGRFTQQDYDNAVRTAQNLFRK